jgi:hypothetical protein
VDHVLDTPSTPLATGDGLGHSPNRATRPILIPPPLKARLSWPARALLNPLKPLSTTADTDSLRERAAFRTTRALYDFLRPPTLPPGSTGRD